MQALEIRDLSFEYPETEKAALDDISLSVREGEILCLCGETGSGKTTLLRSLKPMIAPHGRKRGEILFFGKNTDDLSRKAQARDIGFVMQDPDNQIVTDKVWHEIAFGLENIGMAPEMIRLRSAEMANFFGIEGWFERSTWELSGGQKQILSLAAVMALSPRLLILDEPASRLDPVSAGDFLSAVRKVNRELGTTVIISEHRTDDILPMADRLAIMKNGKIAFEGPVQEVAGKITGSRSSDDHDLLKMMPLVLQAYDDVVQLQHCSEMEQDQSVKKKELPLDVAAGRRWVTDLECFIDQKDEGRKKDKRGAADNGDDQRRKLPGRDRGEYAVTFRNIWFRYKKEDHDVIRGLTLKIKKGETAALMGGNGAGKSTILSLISKTRTPYRGRVTVNGSSSGLPQDPQLVFTKETVGEDLAVTAPPDSEEYKRAVSAMELDDLLCRHPFDLSGGEQQRAAIAKVLMTGADILLFDEPTKGLDGRFRKKLAGIISDLKKQGRTVLIVSHDMEFCARSVDRCIMIFDADAVTDQKSSDFFRGNAFYTTSINRMAGHVLPDAVLPEDLAAAISQGNAR